MTMTRALLIALTLTLTACSGSGRDDTAPDTTTAETTSTTERIASNGDEPATPHWTPAPADTPRPKYLDQVGAADAKPYQLDYGQILWIDGRVGRLIGPTGECDDLMGGHNNAEWHERYADIPGFQGLVCNLDYIPD